MTILLLFVLTSFRKYILKNINFQTLDYLEEVVWQDNHLEYVPTDLTILMQYTPKEKSINMGFYS